MDIFFVTRKAFANWRDIEQLDESFVDVHPERFRSGIDVWIAQTFLRLRAPLAVAGVGCRFVDRFVPGQICVAHRDDLNAFSSGAHKSFIVGIRADRPPLYVCEHLVRQNNIGPDSPGTIYLPHWPQPGIKARDPARGDEVRKVGYLGRDSAAPAWFRDGSLQRTLAEIGVEFDIRTNAWHDYSDIDVLLAYREELPWMLRHKPATKLYNAWIAGMPALLSDEPAYCALQQSELDFMIVHDAATIRTAIEQLKSNPTLYRAMVANGTRRATAFTPTAITKSWTAFLLDTVLPAHALWQRTSPLDIAGFWMRMAKQKLAAKLFRRGIEFGAR